MRGLQQLCSLIVTIWAVSSIAIAQTPPEVRLGAFQITFAESNPLSEQRAQSQRYGIRISDEMRYTLSAESYEVYVPEDYSADQKYGLLVWVNAGPTGKPPEMWLDVLKKRKLIWIGANNTGNQRNIAIRFGLALDAAHNMLKQYNIDDERVYVSGISGGGKVASLLGLSYPEVFTGAAPIVGVAYFRDVKLPDDSNRVWPATIRRPPVAILNKARLATRFVLITGSNDFNRDSTKGMYENGFVRDRYKYVQYVEVPGMGHELAPAEVMDGAVEFMDSALGENASGE